MDARATSTNVTLASDWLTSWRLQRHVSAFSVIFNVPHPKNIFFKSVFVDISWKSIENFFYDLNKRNYRSVLIFSLLSAIIFFVKFLVRLRMATRDCDLLLCVIWVVVGLVTIRRNNVKRVVKSWLVTSDCSGIKIRN